MTCTTPLVWWWWLWKEVIPPPRQALPVLAGQGSEPGEKMTLQDKNIAVLGFWLHEQHASIKPELKPVEKLQPDGHTLALVSPWGDT